MGRRLRHVGEETRRSVTVSDPIGAWHRPSHSRTWTHSVAGRRNRTARANPRTSWHPGSVARCLRAPQPRRVADEVEAVLARPVAVQASDGTAPLGADPSVSASRPAGKNRAMPEGPSAPSPSSPVRGAYLLLAVVIAAIVVMPFAAGRHPSGAQTVLVMTACVALATIALTVLASGMRGEPSVQRRTGELPAPDEITAYRQRASGASRRSQTS